MSEQEQCGTCGSQWPSVRLCLHCKTAHIMRLPSNQVCVRAGKTRLCDNDAFHDQEQLVSSLRTEVERLKQARDSLRSELGKSEDRVEALKRALAGNVPDAQIGGTL